VTARRRKSLLRIHLVPTKEFAIQRALLTELLGEKAVPVFEALEGALEKLKESGWGPDLDIRKIGGNDFAYRFHEQYEVTFCVSGQKPAEGPIEEMWLDLLTIQIRNRDKKSG